MKIPPDAMVNAMEGILTNTIEIKSIDTKYETFRLPNKRRERDLLASMGEKGIETPFRGVSKGEIFVLLDGFKRLRCARKLKINIVPVEELAETERDAVLKLLQISNAQSLHILEQVQLVNDLYSIHGMKVREIANRLEKSPAWVSMRLGILKEFGPCIWEKVFKGQFPASNMIYTLRQFRRLNRVEESDINDFVDAVSGKGIGHRDIHSLAHAWFQGGQETREHIKTGDMSWALKKARGLDDSSESNFCDSEKRILKDMEIVQKYMGRVAYKLPLLKPKSESFMATAGLLAEGILEKQGRLSAVLKTFVREAKDDQCRQTKGGMVPIPRRDERCGAVAQVGH